MREFNQRQLEESRVGREFFRLNMASSLDLVMRGLKKNMRIKPKEKDKRESKMKVHGKRKGLYRKEELEKGSP